MQGLKSPSNQLTERRHSMLWRNGGFFTNFNATEVAPRGYVEDLRAFGDVGEFQHVESGGTLGYSPVCCFLRLGDLKDDEELVFTESSSQAKVAYYHVWNGSWISLYDAPSHQMIGTIEYTFEFFEPKDAGTVITTENIITHITTYTIRKISEQALAQWSKRRRQPM